MKKKSVKKIITIILVSLLVLIILGMVSIYLYYGYTHRNEFFKSVTINNTYCGGMTVEEVETMIQEKAENYTLTVSTLDGKSQTITTDLINYHYVSDGSVQKYFEEQKWWQWIKGYINGNDVSYNATVTIEYDKEALKSLMNSWDFMQPANQIAPVDASISYENSKYIIVDEVNGTTINADTLYSALCTAVDSTATELSVEATGAYVQPSIKKDNELLNENCKFLNANANFTITHTMPDGNTHSLTRDDFFGWLSIDANGKYYKDDTIFSQQIKSYVDILDSEIDDLNKGGYTFSGSDGETHTVQSYVTIGWVLDSKEEIAQLTEDIKSCVSLTREPVYSSKASSVNGGIGSTYVEIDLSGQHLWYYKNGSLALSCDIISGNPNIASRKTPGGIYKVYNKERNRTLKGEVQSDGSYEYQTPVSYWMPFNGGIGMHDATWQSAFGGDLYYTVGSHGCINMSLDTAAQLYDIISVGCIVVCYY